MIARSLNYYEKKLLTLLTRKKNLIVISMFENSNIFVPHVLHVREEWDKVEINEFFVKSLLEEKL